MNAPQMMILSTNGSIIRPSLVTWLNLRAHQPSIQSVAAAIVKTIIAAKKWPRGMRMNTTIDSTKRLAVMTLGTLRIAFEACCATSRSIWPSRDSEHDSRNGSQRQACRARQWVTGGNANQVVFLRRDNLDRHDVAGFEALAIARDEDKA